MYPLATGVYPRETSLAPARFLQVAFTPVLIFLSHFVLKRETRLLSLLTSTIMVRCLSFFILFVHSFPSNKPSFACPVFYVSNVMLFSNLFRFQTGDQQGIRQHLKTRKRRFLKLNGRLSLLKYLLTKGIVHNPSSPQPPPQYLPYIIILM